MYSLGTNIISNRSSGQFRKSEEGITLIHIMQVGASTSAGGAGTYHSAPALTTVGESNVLTLTDGPLAPSTVGDFITCVEGDTYDQDAIPQSYPNIESSATSLGQQLYSLIGSSNYRICITYHYRGGTAMQLFNVGQTHSSFGYDEMTSTVTRVKSLCDANEWSYVPHLSLVQSVSGISATAVEDWVDSMRSFITPTYYANTLKVLVSQGKIAGNPEYGQAAYTSAANRTDCEVVFPVRALTIASEEQPDNIHYTNHGQRRTGVNWAFNIYENLFGGGFTPLTIDESNISYDDGAEEITVPILNATGALQGSGDYGIIVYDTTASLTVAGTWSISGTNIIFAISGNKPDGTSTIEFQADQSTGSLIDSRSNAAVIFNAADSNPYGVEKPLIRNTFSKSLAFPSGDITPPTFTSSPVSDSVASTSMNILATLSENGTVYVKVVLDGGSVPSVDTIIEDNEFSEVDSGSGVTIAVSGLTASTAYDIYVAAKDTAGNNIVAAVLVEETTSSGGNTVLKRFNFGSNTTPTVADWESVEGDPMSNTSVDIEFTDPATGWGGFSFTAKNTNTTNKWGFINSTASGSSNLGHVTGDDSGVVPDDVLQNYWYTQGGTDLEIDGFDDLESYTLRIVPSRTTSSSPRVTQYIIGATTQSIESYLNTANEVVFTGVTSISGTVTINVSSLSSSFGYLNSIIIELE